MYLFVELGGYGPRREWDLTLQWLHLGLNINKFLYNIIDRWGVVSSKHLAKTTRREVFDRCFFFV